MTIVTPSMPPKSSVSWAGSLKWGLRPDCGKRSNGICRIRSGWTRPAAAHMANGSKRIMPGVQKRRQNERDYPGRRKRDATVSADHRDQQTNAARLRQTDGVLSAFDADVCRHT